MKRRRLANRARADALLPAWPSRLHDAATPWQHPGSKPAPYLIRGPGQALDGRLSVRAIAWYAKQQATFSDALASVRWHLWEAEYFSTSTPDTEQVETPRVYLQCLMQSACYTH